MNNSSSCHAGDNFLKNAQAWRSCIKQVQYSDTGGRKSPDLIDFQGMVKQACLVGGNFPNHSAAQRSICGTVLLYTIEIENDTGNHGRGL